MAAAAEQAAADGVRSMVGFTYRRVPAIALARQLVAEGRLGDDPARPRPVPAGLDRRPGRRRCRGGCEKDKAGSGALGDIGAHIVDLAQFITGETHRPGSPGCWRPSSRSGRCRASTAGSPASAGAGTGTVTVDDAAVFLGRFRGGALGVFEATRFAIGPQERHPHRDQRLARAAWPSTSRT